MRPCALAQKHACARARGGRRFRSSKVALCTLVPRRPGYSSWFLNMAAEEGEQLASQAAGRHIIPQGVVSGTSDEHPPLDPASPPTTARSMYFVVLWAAQYGK